MISADVVQHVAVIGAGRFGAELALDYARVGFDVTLIDVDPVALDRAVLQNRQACRVMTETGYLSAEQSELALRRIRLATQLDDVLPSADFALEAIPDRLDAKQALFERIERLCRDEVFFGLTSQALPIAQITAAMSRPERVVRYHWLQPAFLLPAVEIVRDDHSSAEAIEFARRLLQRAGKKPIVVADIPGLILNRFQHLLYTEALSIVEQGAATIQDVDDAFRYGLSMRYALWSILGTHDRVASKDQSLSAGEALRRATGDQRYGPSQLMREKVERGEVGIWAGKGWYDYTGQSLDELIDDRDTKLSKIMAMLEGNGFF